MDVLSSSQVKTCHKSFFFYTCLGAFVLYCIGKCRVIGKVGERDRVGHAAQEPGRIRTWATAIKISLNVVHALTDEPLVHPLITRA